jgi:hypothetical protein
MMNVGFFRRWRRRRRRLDLDDRRVLTEELEVLAPDSGRRTPRKMAVLFLQRVLCQTLHDQCDALNLFYGGEVETGTQLVFSSRPRNGDAPRLTGSSGPQVA